MIKSLTRDNPAYLPILASAYAKRAIDRDALEAWIVAHLPDLLASSNELVGNLVRLIELRFAEITLGHRDEDELRMEILDVLADARVLLFDLSDEPARPTSSSESTRVYATVA